MMFPALRRICGALFLFALPLTLRAQTDTTFFGADWKTVPNRQAAAYYHLTPVKVGDRYHIRDYYLDQQLQMDGWFRDDQEKVRDGSFAYYYRNGVLKSKRKYLNGREDSVWTYYTPAGKITKTETWQNGQLHGVSTTYDGNGQLHRREIFAHGSRTEVHAYDANGLELESVPEEEVVAPPATTDATSRIFKYVEQMPEFSGDINGYLSGQMTYPEEARSHNKEGRVIVEFVIDEQGKISSATVIRSSGTPELDDEALRVVRGMPDWTPGYQSGRPVKVYYTLPITFKLK